MVLILGKLTNIDLIHHHCFVALVCLVFCFFFYYSSLIFIFSSLWCICKREFDIPTTALGHLPKTTSFISFMRSITHEPLTEERKRLKVFSLLKCKLLETAFTVKVKFTFFKYIHGMVGKSKHKENGAKRKNCANLKRISLQLFRKSYIYERVGVFQRLKISRYITVSYNI